MKVWLTIIVTGVLAARFIHYTFADSSQDLLDKTVTDRENNCPGQITSDNIWVIWMIAQGMQFGSAGHVDANCNIDNTTSTSWLFSFFLYRYETEDSDTLFQLTNGGSRVIKFSKEKNRHLKIEDSSGKLTLSTTCDFCYVYEKWMLFAVYYDHTTSQWNVRLYPDSSGAQYDTSVTLALPTVNLGLRIGWDGAWDSFDGVIYEFMLFKDAYTGFNLISSDYNLGICAGCSACPSSGTCLCTPEDKSGGNGACIGNPYIVCTINNDIGSTNCEECMNLPLADRLNGSCTCSANNFIDGNGNCVGKT